jgi:hypothetical protein
MAAFDSLHATKLLSSVLCRPGHGKLLAPWSTRVRQPQWGRERLRGECGNAIREEESKTSGGKEAVVSRNIFHAPTPL